MHTGTLQRGIRAAIRFGVISNVGKKLEAADVGTNPRLGQPRCSLLRQHGLGQRWPEAPLTPLLPLVGVRPGDPEDPQLRVGQTFDLLKRDKVKKRQEGEGKEATHISKGGRMGPFCPALSFAPTMCQGSLPGDIRNVSGMRLSPAFSALNSTPALPLSEDEHEDHGHSHCSLALEWGAACCSGKAGVTQNPIQHIPCLGKGIESTYNSNFFL